MPSEEVISAATLALERARCSYRPHDGKTGVALIAGGRVFMGATFQACAYPNSICAVQAAVVNAVSEGAKIGDLIQIVGEADLNQHICGRCLQVLQEHVSPSTEIHFLNVTTKHASKSTLQELLPQCVEPQKPVTGEVSGTSVGTYNFGKTIPNCPFLRKLFNSAIDACSRAYVPLSNFPVGAAVATDDNVIIWGSNVENSSMGTGLCAERVALSKAVTAGAKTIKVLAVVCYKMEDFSSPCGSCRQSIVEFGDVPIWRIKLDHANRLMEVSKTSAFALLPDAFVPESLA